MKVLRYGFLRSAPVVVDAGYARSESLVDLHTPVLAPPRWLTASPPRAIASSGPLHPRHREGFSVPAECSSHASSDRSRRSPEMQIACSFLLPLRAVGVTAPSRFFRLLVLLVCALESDTVSTRTSSAKFRGFMRLLHDRF